MVQKLPVWAEADKVGMNSAAKSAGIAIGSGFARLTASFLGALILARFLTPEDFGLVAIATPVILLMGAFADGGVSTHTLQRKTLTQRTLTLSFWLALGSGLIVAGVVVLLSPLIMIIFQDDRLVNIISLLAFSIVFSVLGSQHNALAKKYHRQNLYGVAEIIAAFLSLFASVYLAYLGAGYWALVAIPVVRQGVHTIVMWVLVGWTPGKPFYDNSLMREVIGFSSYILIFQFVNVLNKSIDKWFLGYNQDPEALGYYAMAFSIMMLPSMQLLTPIGGAVIPELSRIYHYNKINLADTISKITVVLLGVISPAMIWASINAELLISIVLGEKWLPSAPIFSVLSLVSILMTILSIVGWTYTAVGNSRILSNLSIVSVLVLTLTSMIGTQYGALVMAWVLFANFAFMALIYYAFLFSDRSLKLPVLKYVRDVLLVVGWSAIVGFVTDWLFSMLSMNEYLRLVICLALTMLGAIGGVLVAFASLRKEILYKLRGR